MKAAFLESCLLLALCWALAAPPLAGQEEPKLPKGLDEPGQEEPKLPKGLDEPGQEEPKLPKGIDKPGRKEPAQKEPALPAGLGEGEEKKEAGAAGKAGGLLDRLPFDLTGFVEIRVGSRTRNDPYEKDMSVGEGRLQLEAEKTLSGAIFKVTADFLYDRVTDRHELRLERGEGWLDLREANVLLSPFPFMDLKAGRQVLTWGMGDLLFINDLFPKDWNSFFMGRDEEYLKAPSDAVKASFFTGLANVDVVFTPRFDPDRFIDGRRISFWNGALGRTSGRDAPIHADIPDDWLDESETALRVYRNIQSYELAIYGYKGYWKSPGGISPATGKAVFPRLTVAGASARGTLLGGIANVEAGQYFSEDDSGGRDPLVRNSEFRFLAGFEKEAARDFTIGFQYYLESMMNYGAYKRALPAGSPRADRNHHVLTLRLTRLLLDQNLTLSLFTFYSPSDDDAYLRPDVRYKMSDDWAVEAGANVFTGKDRYTFFGQFEKNTNVYLSIRRSF